MKALEVYEVPIKTPEFRNSICINDEVSSIAFSPVDDKIAIRRCNTLIEIYDNYGLNENNDNKAIRQIGKILRFNTDNTDKSVCFSPDGQFIVYSTVVPDEGNVINITGIMHNTKDKNIQSSYGHPRSLRGRIHTIVISPNGEIIASASSEQVIRIGFLKQEKTDLLPHDNTVKSIAIRPDSNTLAAGDCKGNILLWNLKTLKALEEKEFGIPEQLNTFTIISSLTFSPDGQSLAVAGKGKSKCQDKLCIWKLGTKQVVEIFPNQRFVNSIAYNPVDNRILVSAGKDKTIKLWNIKSKSPQEEICTLDKHKEIVTSVAFSYDGKFLASGSRDGIVHIWDTLSI